MGQAVYRDHTTDSSGAPAQAATPPAQRVNVTVTVSGQGSIPQIDPRCATDPVGAFEAHYAADAQMSSSAGYVAAFSQGTLTTPSGCAVSSLTVSAITDVVIRGELAIDTTNCQTYCAASARADAQAQCASSADQTTCRANAESSLAAQCQTTCTTQAHAIVAEVHLGASALGQVTADELKSAAFADLSAKLTFDHLEDVNGNKL